MCQNAQRVWGRIGGHLDLRQSGPDVGSLGLTYIPPGHFGGNRTNSKAPKRSIFRPAPRQGENVTGKLRVGGFQGFEISFGFKQMVRPKRACLWIIWSGFKLPECLGKFIFNRNLDPKSFNRSNSSQITSRAVSKVQVFFSALNKWSIITGPFLGWLRDVLNLWNFSESSILASRPLWTLFKIHIITKPTPSTFSRFKYFFGPKQMGHPNRCFLRPIESRFKFVELIGKLVLGF